MTDLAAVFNLINGLSEDDIDRLLTLFGLDPERIREVYETGTVDTALEELMVRMDADPMLITTLPPDTIRSLLRDEITTT